MSKELLNIRQLSEYLKIPVGTLYHFAGERRIPFYKVSNLLRFDKAAIDQWLERARIDEKDTSSW